MLNRLRRREKSKTLGELRLIDQDTPYGGRTARTWKKATRTLAAEWSIRMMPARPGKKQGRPRPAKRSVNSLCLPRAAGLYHESCPSALYGGLFNQTPVPRRVQSLFRDESRDMLRPPATADAPRCAGTEMR